MTGTYSPVGLPVSIAGLWYRPPYLAINATLGADGRFTEPWRSGASNAVGTARWTTGDVLPVALPTPALTVMVARGAATMIG